MLSDYRNQTAPAPRAPAAENRGANVTDRLRKLSPQHTDLPKRETMSSQHHSVTNESDAVASCTVAEERVGDATVIAVSGTIDMLTVPALEAAIETATSTGPAALIVDLSAVDFLASAGMGLLAATHNALTPDTRFAVVADGPATSRPLKLVGIADIVDMHATRDEALAAVAR